MANTNPTPLMNLPNPVPGVDPGPDYANNLSACMIVIDGHNHSAGSGNQINPSGININADLPFNSNYNAILLRSVRFSAQASPISGAQDLGCLYVSGVDLWYNDVSGNQVKMTSGGLVNATSSGISSGTATASFSGGVLIVDSNTNTPANVQCGSVLIGNNTVSPNFVTLAPPNALAAGYTLTMPAALPAAKNFVALDSSGNISAYAPVAAGLTGSNIASATITGSNIASATVTRANIVAVGQTISSSSGLFTTTSNLVVQVTNLSNTFTTFGNPVMVFLQPDGSSNTTNIESLAGTSGLYFYRDGNPIAKWLLPAGSSTPNNMTGGFLFLDVPSAASHQYQVFVQTITGGTVLVEWISLVTYELI